MCLPDIYGFRDGLKFMIDQRMGRRVIRVEKVDAAGSLYQARFRPVGFGATHSVCSSSVPIGSRGHKSCLCLQ